MINKPLAIHEKLNGKIEILSKLKLDRKNLPLLYTPGVAEAVKEIYTDRNKLNKLTIKNNTIAVVTDGSAVLGLGNVGPEAALPVMEGKCVIFKEFGNINAFPICLSTQNAQEIINTVKIISPVFGAINLEDISAPRCFEIEKKLQNLQIPVMHDDQHATAIAVLAGLINSAKVINSDLFNSQITIVGAGAAGTAIAKLLNFYGIKNLILVDSIGVISNRRSDLPDYKKELLKISNKTNIYGELKSIKYKADILIGVSQKGLFTQKIIQNLGIPAIVFALSNPDPELFPKNAEKWGVKIIATGRSDFPNQINNALVFPGFFKGLLNFGYTKVTMDMKIKAACSLAGLISKPTQNKIIPSIFDKRIVPAIVKSLLL